MLNFLCEDAQTPASGLNVGVYVVLLVALLALIVFPMFTQRKRNREYEAMLGSLNVGDLVKTAGGIIGRIKSINNKGEIRTVILETGSKTEKSYMEFDITMIACVLKSTKVQTETVETAEEAEEAEEEAEEPVENQEATEEPKAEKPKVETPAEEVEEVKEAPAEEPKPAKKRTTTKTSVKKTKK